MFGKKKDKPSATDAAGEITWRRDPDSPLPQFYSDVALLDAAKHGALKLGRGDEGFARAAVTLPLTPMEFAAAAAHFPIVFARDGSVAWPFAVVGRQGRCAFIGPDKLWRRSVYAPAFIRRYPFVGVGDPANDLFALGFDPGASCLARDGKTLFEKGAPTQLAQDALALCKEMHFDQQRGMAFASALLAENVLAEAAVGEELGEGNWAAHGLLAVDAERVGALSETTMHTWADDGWLRLIELHLQSQAHWDAVLQDGGAVN